MLQCETLAQAAAGTAIQVGMPTREQSALVSPVEPACAPQDHLEPCCCATCAPSRARASSSAPSSSRVESGADGVRAVAARCARAATARSCAPATSSPPTARTAPCGARSASPCAARITSPRSSRRCSARRSGTLLGEHRLRHLQRHPPRGRAASSCPAGRDDRWLYGVYWDPARAGGRLRRGRACAS